jgi:vacuolar-type H+-ATPase subunit F/Vma7
MELALICDELTAIGWRLAGAQVNVPALEDTAVEEAWRKALGTAEVVLITAGLAARLPEESLTAAVAAARPLVGVIADLRHAHEPADPEDQVHRVLGML